ncbi:DUF1868 domain-containing protein [Granulicella sp. WH15]|uniref:DUF1868 domain-containing protein n=1 Tax=Granulicella sp. WH15 TaxID=2602070 RepID=UPI001367396F|nr:DUF1868 domain-containing protein [Granulicella sp. WH15]QHN03094.1 DUF1868 domain-containing protein [Granulicella sp. WH15]
MKSYAKSLSRRHMLKLSAGIGAYSVLNGLTGAIAEPLSQTGNTPPPHSSNPNANKFAEDRTARPFAGNTVICPLPKDSLIFQALTHVHHELTGHPFAQRLALLPPSSYHSTIFSGANDADRKPDVWPSDIPFDTPISECNQTLKERIGRARFPLSLPLRFRIDADPQSQPKDVSSIRLLPFDEAENRKVRDLRNRLSEVMKIHAPDHDSYRFHISLGYWVQPRTPEELADYDRVLAAALNKLTSEIHSIDLQAPVFCTFENMLSYSPREWLKIVPPGSVVEYTTSPRS